MSATHVLLSSWDLEPTVIIGCALLLVAYGAGWLATVDPTLKRRATITKPRERGWNETAHGRADTRQPALAGFANVARPCRRPPLASVARPCHGGRLVGRERAPSGRYLLPLGPRPLLFLTGVLVLLFALISPLDTLGDTYLFSAHMAQHLLLIEVVPPLLLVGVAPAMFARLLSWRPAAAVERVLGQPTLAWFVGVGTVWVWHAPGMYNAALASENVHIVEHLSFLVASTMFWWPVVAPLPEHQRLPNWATAGYLAAGALASSILGIILTFSPPGMYPAYLHPKDTLGLLPLIRDNWGLTPMADQRLGGGLMWMLGGPVYLIAMVLSIARWFGDADEAFELELETPPKEEVQAVR